jgi:glucose-1-phosphate thymidylyltransferase
MNILILAAGYATRLYPLTENKAKPLLKVAGKPMVEWVLDNLAPIPDVDRVYVVTNNKFAKDFEEWAADYKIRQPKLDFTIINDGSTSDADKLGAIGDMHYVLQTQNISHQDLLVVAGDNLFSQPIPEFAEAAKQYPATLALYDVGDLEAIRKYNNVTTDSSGIITHFEEKPTHPQTTKTGIALYYYRADILPLIERYVSEGNNPDQPGRLIQWLYTQVQVSTWDLPGTWFDIGSKETLLEANEVFQKFTTK